MSNYDEKTGIHYGVISPNSINQETLSDLCDKSTDTIYEESKKEIEQQINSLFEQLGIRDNEKDYETIREMMLTTFNENYDNDYHGYEYEDNEYSLHICDDNFGIFVIKSPYYTYCKQCSPCAPGAGDLDNSISKAEYEKGDHNAFMYGTVKAYCLPRDFFDNEYAKIQYRYYNVSDDKEVLKPIIEVD